MTAPDLRPGATTDTAAPGGGLPSGLWVLTDSHGVPVPGVTVTSVELHREPEQPSGIGDVRCTLPSGGPPAHQTSGQTVRGVAIDVPNGAEAVHVYDRGGELLAKVLPAGGPLVTTWWTCTECGHERRGAPPAKCQARGPYYRCPLSFAAS